MIHEAKAKCGHWMAWRADAGSFKADGIYLRAVERENCHECRLGSIEAEHKATLDMWRSMMSGDAKKILALDLRVLDLEAQVAALASPATPKAEEK